MSAIVFCVPYMDRAKGLASSFHDAPYDNSAFALDMNPNFSVPRKSGGDDMTLDFDIDPIAGLFEKEWKDDANAGLQVIFDFGAVWLANWKTFNGPSVEGSVKVYADSTTSFPSPSLWQTMFFDQMKGPLLARRFPTGTQTESKAWRFEFGAVNPDTLPGPPEVSFICVGRSYKIDAQWNWNAPDSRRHLNVVDELDSGRILVRNQNRRGIQVRMLRFELLTTADYENIRDAHRDARGRYMPIIVGTVVDNPSVGEYIDNVRLMRFATDELQEQPVQAGLWNVDVPLIEVPWLERPYAY